MKRKLVPNSIAWAICISLGVSLISVAMFPLQHFPPNNREEPAKTPNGNGNQSKAETNRGANQDDKKGTKEQTWYEIWQEHRTDWLLVLFNGLLVVFNVGLYWSTKGLWDSAKEQSKDTRRSIEEATRAASAMERVADGVSESVKSSAESIAALRERTAMQMRAYLSVLAGGVIYQERDKNFRFEAKPNLINAGQTPAHKVSYWANAAILPVPLPPDFDFSQRRDVKSQNHAAVLAPHQVFILNRWIDDFVPDEEVPLIKLGAEKALYVWGTVTYEDIFGQAHYTNFAQWTNWSGANESERAWTYYCQKHNDAN